MVTEPQPAAVDPYGSAEDYDTAEAYGPPGYDDADYYDQAAGYGAADSGAVDYSPAGSYPGAQGAPGYPADGADGYDDADTYGPPDSPDRRGYHSQGGYAQPGLPGVRSGGPPGMFGTPDAVGLNGAADAGPPPVTGAGFAGPVGPAAQTPRVSRAEPASQASAASLAEPASPARPVPSGSPSLPPPSAGPGDRAPDHHVAGRGATAADQPGRPGRHAGLRGQPAVTDSDPRAARPVTADNESRAARPVTADSLTADLLLPDRHKAPSSGWRRAIFEVTGGLIRAPESATERRRHELAARAQTPVAGGHHRVAVLSLKGGVGKTTTTMGLGSTLASLRGDRVIAVDANPDRGTLSDKLRLETAATVRDLLNERVQVQRYADVRAYTTQAASRLEVLASDRDPTVSVAFSDQDYSDVTQVLEHYYSICITDCGTGLLHSAMRAVLYLADQIVLVSSPSVDGARSASATLDWLQAHGYGDLVRNAVVVLSVIRPRGKSTVDLERLEQHFSARCRAVVRIPYDAHLEEGAEVDLGLLSRATADAYLLLAAEVADGFAQPSHRAR